MSTDLESHLNAEQLAILESLNTPADIQAYLDRIPYSPEDNNRCPASVLRDEIAHCLDGGLFAAAALQRIGYGAFYRRPIGNTSYAGNVDSHRGPVRTTCTQTSNDEISLRHCVDLPVGTL